MNKVITFSLSLLITLVSCGPVYQTEYTYIPPETQSGKTCVFQCENIKLQCIQLEELRYERCMDRADREYYRCERNRRYEYKDGKKKCVRNCYCYRATCTMNQEPCELKYRSCYGSCGGTVESQTYCVANCDKANPGVPVK